MKRARARSAARMPACAAQPGCRRLVHAPSARYSMMPLASEPTTPSAFTHCAFGSRSAVATHGDAGERVAAIETLALRHRQDRGHDHRAGVHRSAFECVVEVFAMCGGAIHERGARAVASARMADGDAVAIALPAR